MIIYKITNKENNKVYIGQTIRTLQQRFNRHKNDALHNILNTHFARAIREYGPDAFIAEVIDTAETQEELNKKNNIGYNIIIQLIMVTMKPTQQKNVVVILIKVKLQKK